MPVVFDDKKFMALTPHKQREVIAKYPAYILRLPKLLKQNDSLSEDSYVYELKKVALAKDGFLFVHFEKNGLSVNEKLANIALIAYPELIKEEAVYPYLTEENIKKAVLRKPELVASIPNEFMTQNMYKFCNRVLRNYIREDEANFRLLPPEVRSFSFSVTNAYTKNVPTNVLELQQEAATQNGGKMMYKIVRREPGLLLAFAPEVWRRNLVATAVTIMPEIYKELPEEFKQDQLIQFRTYKALQETGKAPFIDQYFTAKEMDRAHTKLMALYKRQRRLKCDEETIDAIDEIAKNNN